MTPSVTGVFNGCRNPVFFFARKVLCRMPANGRQCSPYATVHASVSHGCPPGACLYSCIDILSCWIPSLESLVCFHSRRPGPGDMRPRRWVGVRFSGLNASRWRRFPGFRLFVKVPGNRLHARRTALGFIPILVMGGIVSPKRRCVPMARLVFYRVQLVSFPWFRVAFLIR